MVLQRNAIIDFLLHVSFFHTSPPQFLHCKSTNSPILPEMYEHVYKAVCEADYTNINLGKLHPEFYEYGRYLIPFDSTNLIGRILFQTLCHRVQHLLDSSKTVFKPQSSQNKMDRLEGHLLEMGIRTYKLVRMLW